MERNEKLKILLPVLILIAIFVWVRAFKAPVSKRRAKGNIESVGIASPEDEPFSFARTQGRKRTKTSYTHWGRNPFTLKVSAPTITKLILSGVVWDEVNPQAIISDKILKIGDKIGGYTVVDIKQDSVILNDGTSNFELRLGQERW